MPIQIISQLSENQVESDVASYLGYITPLWSKRYRLIKVDEQLTGADKLFNRFVPIYMQFKVSHGLNPGGTILQRFQNTPLSKIVTYRKSNNLSGNPILYFQLRRKAKTAVYLQHNILHKLHAPPYQYGMYVAPLTLDNHEYYELMNSNWWFRLFPPDPFKYYEQEINDTLLSKNITLGNNPFLRHHISIPPHCIASTHDHHYSYSTSGADLAWHGGEMFNDDFRLSTQMNRILTDTYNSDNSGTTLEDFFAFISNYNKQGGNEFYNTNEPDTRNFPIQTIKNFAFDLKSRYNITLMLLTQPK